MQRVHVGLGEAVQLRPVAEVGLEAVAQQVEERLLADPPALELEEGVGAELLLPADHRDAELLERDARLVLERDERVHQRQVRTPPKSQMIALTGTAADSALAGPARAERGHGRRIS